MTIEVASQIIDHVNNELNGYVMLWIINQSVTYSTYPLGGGGGGICPSQGHCYLFNLWVKCILGVVVDFSDCIDRLSEQILTLGRKKDFHEKTLTSSNSSHVETTCVKHDEEHDGTLKKVTLM